MKYTTFAFVFVWIGGFVWMLAKVRYPNPQEMQMFWEILKQFTLLGSVIGIWIGCAKMEIGNGPFYLTHLIAALLTGAALGLFVLPGDVFLPWLVVSMIFGGALYFYLVFFMLVKNTEKKIQIGLPRAKYPVRYPVEEDVIRRSITVPIFLAIYIAFLNSLKDESDLFLSLSSFTIYLLVAIIASHYYFFKRNKIL